MGELSFAICPRKSDRQMVCVYIYTPSVRCPSGLHVDFFVFCVERIFGCLKEV